MRLARFLAQAGIASRRKAEALITAGLVSVNGVPTTRLGTVIDPAKDSVTVRGKKVKAEKYVYYLLHKPVGYVCSVRDPQEKQVVTKLVPRSPRVYPVGRLDKDSSGLLLMTNDGDLTLRLTHPRYTVEKTYEVTIDRPYTPALLARLKRGVGLTEGRASADSVRPISRTRLEITVHQGWNRQIRRMLAVCGYSALALKRVAEGRLTLGALPEGKYKLVQREDILE